MIFLLFACQQEPLHIDGMVRLELPQGDEYFIDVYEYPNTKGQHPTAMLSLESARELCGALRKRLCTAEEWRYACQNGASQNRYVYGDTYRPDVCNSNQQLKGGHTSLIHNKKEYAKSGQFTNCVTENGIFDMVGNLEEWVADDWRSLQGNLEGGAWYSHQQYADCTGRYSRQPDYRLSIDRQIDSAGVRCCWSKSPPSQDDISADAKRRITQARELSSTASYDPSNEVQLASGVWIDVYEYPNRKGEMPVVSVTWEEASDRCAEAEKRLCTVQEWEQACSGTSFLPYPYGRIHKPSVCIDERDSPLASGTYSGCKSDYGVFDLTGGVWEWTSSDLTVSELQGNSKQRLKEVRGGSWYSDSLKARCKPTVGYPTAPSTTAFPDVGFRCCRGSQEVTPVQPLSVTSSCPENMVAIESGCIDRYEYPNKQGEQPMNSVDHKQAIRQCEEQGKHLCSNTEWLRACEGQERRRWSYGNEYQADRCNHNADTTQRGPVPSGTLTGCHTPDFTYDLTGNLWEWTQEGSVRGGNWNFSEGMGQCRSFASPLPTIASREYGFRCCASTDEVLSLSERQRKR